MKTVVINPGSTSTKIALFEDGEALVLREFQHAREDLSQFESVLEQQPYRMEIIRKALHEMDVKGHDVDAVSGRGGLLHALEGGVYAVNNDMLHDLREAKYGEHPCNLGAILAQELALEWGVPAYIVDPVVTDEMTEIARFTGMPGVHRRSLFHALSQRGVARTVASQLGMDYMESRFIVCHMGGGVSIGAHRKGRVVDVVNALDGEGPFSPERVGGLPVLTVLDMLENGFEPVTLRKKVLREGGVFAHLGTNDLREVEALIRDGDSKARLVFDALVYAISKHIASLLPSFTTKERLYLDGIILTGGLARSATFTSEIKSHVGFAGPVFILTGDEEMAALAAGAERVLQGKEKSKSYTEM